MIETHTYDIKGCGGKSQWYKVPAFVWNGSRDCEPDWFARAVASGEVAFKDGFPTLRPDPVSQRHLNGEEFTIRPGDYITLSFNGTVQAIQKLNFEARYERIDQAA